MEINIKNVRFSNVPNKKLGTKISEILTQSNIGLNQDVSEYLQSQMFYKLVNAIDIDWNGIEVTDGLIINDTADLINWILTLPTSAEGVKGEKGDKGDKGDTGEQGPKGDKGDTGEAGPQGPQGIQGIQGEQGPQGIQGETGAQGPQGLQGEKGDPGEGFTISHEYASVSEMNDDFSNDTVDQNQFVIILGSDPKAEDYGKVYMKGADAWRFIVDMSVTGVKGDKGDKGDTGEQGIQGPQGIQGEQGIQGPQGEQGPQGPKGDKGDTGEVDLSVLKDYAKTSDVEAKLGNLSGAPIITSPSHVDYIKDEASWNESFQNGVLKRYYTAYPNEDLWNLTEHRAANFNDKAYDATLFEDAAGTVGVKSAQYKATWISDGVQKITNLSDSSEVYFLAMFYSIEDTIYELFTDQELQTSANLFIQINSASFPGCIQCWEGAINATGVRFPWVCVLVEEDIAAEIEMTYEGKGTIKPWNDKKFGLNQKLWGIASMPTEFQDNGFLTPETQKNSDPSWEGEVGANNFDINKLTINLIQENKKSVKQYVDEAISKIELTPGPQGERGETGPQGPAGEISQEQLALLATKEELSSLQALVDANRSMSILLGATTEINWNKTAKEIIDSLQLSSVKSAGFDLLMINDSDYASSIAAGLSVVIGENENKIYYFPLCDENNKLLQATYDATGIITAISVSSQSATGTVVNNMKAEYNQALNVLNGLENQDFGILGWAVNISQAQIDQLIGSEVQVGYKDTSNIPANPAAAYFKSFSSDGQTVYGVGQVQETGEVDGNYKEVEVLSNTSTDPNATDFVGSKFWVESTATPDDDVLYPLYDSEKVNQGISVKVYSTEQSLEEPTPEPDPESD